MDRYRKLSTSFSAWVVTTLLIFSGCHRPGEFDDSPFEVGKIVGKVSDKSLYEISGMVASRANDGKFWVHNDSGNPASISLLDSAGTVTCTIKFPGIKNIDWEDIAIGPGFKSDANYLYVGDIGDNIAKRKFKLLYRFPEPSISGNTDTVATGLDSIRFVLSDKARDTEAMVVDPLTRDIYIFSKREDEINAYKLPYPQETIELDTAQYLLTLPFTQVVAADISADGNELLVKSYSTIYYWQRQENESMEELLQRKPKVVAYVPEPQGEAIAFNLTATGFYTITEVSKGERAPLLFYARRTR